MVTTQPLETAIVACLFVVAIALPAAAQPDYLAPISAPAGSPCGDTAPDCMNVCNTHKGSAGACQLNSQIGDYLRANWKRTCGLCDSQSAATPSSASSAGVPSPSQGTQLPVTYGTRPRSGTLSPSPCSFSCVDIPPPNSPYTCAEQERFGKCNSTFMTIPTPAGLPLGYCQITCNRCYESSSCKSAPGTPSASSMTSSPAILSSSSPAAVIASPAPNSLPDVSAMTAASITNSSQQPPNALVPMETSAVPPNPLPAVALPTDAAIPTNVNPPSTLSDQSTYSPLTFTASITPSASTPASSDASPADPASPQGSSIPTPLAASTSPLPPATGSAGSIPNSPASISTITGPSLQGTPIPLPDTYPVATSPGSAGSQSSLAGLSSPASSSNFLGASAEIPFSVTAPLFGVPIAVGSGRSPVQFYAEVPGVAPIQPFITVPATSNAAVSPALEAGSSQGSIPSISLGLAPTPQFLQGTTTMPTHSPTIATLRMSSPEDTTNPPATTSSHETPATNGTTGTSASICLDVPPPETIYTCAEQRDFGKCDAPFMLATNPGAPSGYCQITCGRCGIPPAIPFTTPSSPTSPVITARTSPFLPQASPSTTASSPPPTGPHPSPGFADLPQAYSTAAPSVIQNTASSTSPGSQSTSSPRSTPATSLAAPPPIPAPTPASGAEASSVPTLPEPLPPLLSSPASINAPDKGLQSPVPTPATIGSPLSSSTASDAPTGAPTVPGACTDLQSDCSSICQLLNNDCSQPGGIGDYLRANCKLTCNLCPSPPAFPSPLAGLYPHDSGAIAQLRSPEPSLSLSNCSTHTWITGQWGTCSTTCGFGVQHRTVSCSKYGPSLSLQGTADSAPCDEAVKPVNSTACIALPCPSDYAAACAVSPATAANGRKLLWW